LRNLNIKQVAICLELTTSGIQRKDLMGLFKPDLYRNFAIGFLVGAGLAVWQVAPHLASMA
jgi:hypothetical protein